MAIWSLAVECCEFILHKVVPYMPRTKYLTHLWRECCFCECLRETIKRIWFFPIVVVWVLYGRGGGGGGSGGLTFNERCCCFLAAARMWLVGVLVGGLLGIRQPNTILVRTISERA